MSAMRIQSHVYDIDGSPLRRVEIKNLKTGEIVFSDNSGFFAVEGNDADTLLFVSDGYTATELTIRNVLNLNGKVVLFRQMRWDLPEVTITPANMYELHEKAIYNLKSRLVKHKISYKCEEVEKEINFGDERSLKILFTAEPGKVNPKKTRLDYDILLSGMKVVPGTKKSRVLENNMLYESNLFFNRIVNKMYKSERNSMSVLDSVIVIYNGCYEGDVIVCTINRSDTTLIRIEYESGSGMQKKYRHYITFKAKPVYYSFFAEFKKGDNGYYLYELVRNDDYSFLVGKPEREERIIHSHKISAISDPLPDANLKIKLDTRKLYRMGNYPAEPPTSGTN
jgi:hypothetical protein